MSKRTTEKKKKKKKKKNFLKTAEFHIIMNLKILLDAKEDGDF